MLKKKKLILGTCDNVIWKKIKKKIKNNLHKKFEVT